MTHFVPDGITSSTMPGIVRLAFGAPMQRVENRRTPSDAGLAYEVRRIALADDAWLETWVVPHAEARGVVVMFHGYAASKASLLPAAVLLHRLGYATMLVDFQGAGGSSGTTTTLGMREADDVAAAFAFAVRRWPTLPIALYGASMGGTAVMRSMAIHQLRPAAIVLESPFDRAVQAVRNRLALHSLPAFPLAELLVFWGGVQLGFNGFQHNTVDYAREVTCPTLILHGGRDSRVSMGEIEAITANLRSPHELVTFPQAGHEALAAVDPAHWQARVGQFLAQALAGRT